MLIPLPTETDCQQSIICIVPMPHDQARCTMPLRRRGFGRMRQYLARDMNAAARGFDSVASVGGECARSGDRQALGGEAEKLIQLAEQELHGPSLDTAREHCRAALKALGGGAA